MFRFGTAIFIAAEAADVLLQTQSDCSCAAPDNCYHSNWAAPCSDASDQAACVASGGDWCGQSPSPPPSPSPAPPPAPPPAPSPTPTPTPASGGHCCWSKFGDASTCGNYPASGSGAICGGDGVTPCSSNSDCDSPAPPSPPAPTPTPTPPSPPAPTPTPTPPSPAPAPAGGILGYWDKTWAAGAAPHGANLGVAFNGWANAGHALSDSAGVYNSLTGTKYISIGGGNANGRFSLALVQDLEKQINANAFHAWQGIALDIEECSETGLASAFQAVLAAAKGKGLETMVTVSHSAPYGCTDAHELMQAFLADSNTDYVSPQLYGAGTESSPDFSETTDAGVSWTQYVGMRPKLIPSIVDETHYSPTVDFFTATGVPVAGYVQWATARSASLVV